MVASTSGITINSTRCRRYRIPFTNHRNYSIPSASATFSIMTAGRHDLRLLNTFPSGTRIANQTNSSQRPNGTFPTRTHLIASGRLDRWYSDQSDPDAEGIDFRLGTKNANHLISQFVCHRNNSMPSASARVSIITAGRSDQRLLKAFPLGTRVGNISIYEF